MWHEDLTELVFVYIRDITTIVERKIYYRKNLNYYFFILFDFHSITNYVEHHKVYVRIFHVKLPSQYDKRFKFMSIIPNDYSM